MDETETICLVHFSGCIPDVTYLWYISVNLTLGGGVGIYKISARNSSEPEMFITEIARNLLDRP